MNRRDILKASLLSPLAWFGIQSKQCDATPIDSPIITKKKKITNFTDSKVLTKWDLKAEFDDLNCYNNEPSHFRYVRFPVEGILTLEFDDREVCRTEEYTAFNPGGKDASQIREWIASVQVQDILAAIKRFNKDMEEFSVAPGNIPILYLKDVEFKMCCMTVSSAGIEKD